MRKIAIGLVATAAIFMAQASAQQPQTPGAGGATQKESDLSPLTKQTRNRLIRNPGDIGAVIKEANAATEKARTEIELGIVLAIRYLKTYDPTGYLAISNFLNTNAANPAVAAVQSALSALASTTGSSGPGPGGGGAGGGGGGGGGGGLGSGPGPPASPQ